MKIGDYIFLEYFDWDDSDPVCYKIQILEETKQHWKLSNGDTVTKKGLKPTRGSWSIRLYEPLDTPNEKRLIISDMQQMLINLSLNAGSEDVSLEKLQKVKEDLEKIFT